MSKKWQRVPPGRFKGKKITFASTAAIEARRKLADEFMLEIFDFLPGTYLITDEPDLLDFAEVGSSGVEPMWQKINEVYGVDFEYVGSNRLVTILTAIQQRKRLQ